MLSYPMVEAYTEFLREYVMSSNDNKLQWRLLIKLQSDEIVGALQARALFHFLVLQPLRVIIESTELGSTYLDMSSLVLDLHSFAVAGVNDASILLSESYDPFDIGSNPKVIAYRHRFSDCWKTAFSNVTQTREGLLIQYLTAYCRGVVIQLERNASDFFGGGVLHKPSDTMKDIMKSTPTNNIHCERPFAVYDRKSRVHENADPFTLCAITGAVVTQTFKQLKELPKSVQNWILKTAFYNQAKDRKEAKKILLRIRQLADKARLEKQEKGIKKLAVKMEKWLISEKKNMFLQCQRSTICMML